MNQLAFAEIAEFYRVDTGTIGGKYLGKQYVLCLDIKT